MRDSIRRGVVAAASCALLGLAPGLAMAVGNQNSPTVKQEANQAATGGGSSQTSEPPASGVTSGPAAHSNVVPNTAVPKNENASQTNAENRATGSSEMSTAGKAATGVGAPGAAAKPGTEAGAAPHKSAQQ
jgi:hypothetical protein